MPEETKLKLCDIVGRIGKYQIALMLTTFVAAMFYGILRLAMEVYAPIVNIYWDWEAASSNKTVYLSTDCKMADILNYNKTSNISNSQSKLIYESQYSKRTLTEGLNLVCERSYLVSLANSFLLIGSCFGNIFVSRLSEIYGRKRCMVGLAFLCFISNICILFSQGYVMFALAFSVYGATAGTMYMFMFIPVLEIFPNSWANYVGTLTKVGSLCGEIIFVAVAWCLEDWFYTQIAHTVTAGVFLLTLMYTLESPAWLAVRGRYEDAQETINKILTRNNLEPDTQKLKIEQYIGQIKHNCEEQRKTEKGQFYELFKNRVIACYTIASCLTRSFLLLVYLGLIMNAESFGSGLYIDLTISNVLNLASLAICVLLLKKISLRTLAVLFCLTGGVTCAIYPFLHHIPLARSFLITLGRCLIDPSTTLAFIYFTQISPTSVRGISSGVRQAFSGMVSAISPFSKELAQATEVYVPFILFAVLSFATAAIFKFLPETRGKELVHTVDELVKKKPDVPRPVCTTSTRL